MIKIKKQRFNGSDVMSEAGEYYYIFRHLLNTTNYLVSIVDNEGNIRNTGNIFTKTEMDVKITVPNDSIGTWEVSVYYEDNSQQDLTKKRLFEQDLIPLNDIPNYLDYNVAVGRPSSSTVNMKLADLKSFCQSTLDSSGQKWNHSHRFCLRLLQCPISSGLPARPARSCGNFPAGCPPAADHQAVQ